MLSSEKLNSGGLAQFLIFFTEVYESKSLTSSQTNHICSGHHTTESKYDQILPVWFMAGDYTTRSACVSPFRFLYLGEVLLFLGIVSIAHNLVDAEVGVSAITESHCSRSSGNLLHHQHMFQIAQARATILGWRWKLYGGVEKVAQIKL